MSKIKNTVELKAELSKILDIVDHVENGAPLHRLDRDLALDGLRSIYVAFCELEMGHPTSYNSSSGDQAETIEAETPQIDTIVSCPVEETPITLESTVTTMEELIEKPFIAQPPIARDIIESLYGDSELCRKEKPIEETEIPEEEPEERKEEALQSEKVLNETIGNGTAKDIASVLSSQTASQLRMAIGLNDRLMLLNDLFDNDSEVYDATLTTLDECENIDDAYIYLYEHFTMDDSKDGVKLLISLLEAKFN